MSGFMAAVAALAGVSERVTASYLRERGLPRRRTTMGWAEQMFDDAFKQAEAIHAFINSPVGQALVVVRRGGDAAAEVFISQHETIMDYARQIRELKARVAELEATCVKSS